MKLLALLLKKIKKAELEREMQELEENREQRRLAYEQDSRELDNDDPMKKTQEWISRVGMN